jgi:Tfp pilus assembly protein PilO
MSDLLTQRKPLLIIAALAGVAVIVAGWFLLISPQRAEIAAIRADVEAQESSNSGLRAQISMLQSLQAKLPQQRAALNAISAKVPSKPALPDLVRSLNAAADENGVLLTGITPTAPAEIPNAAGVSGIDVTLTVTGDYLSLEQYQLALERLNRAFLVQGVSISDEAGETDGGRKLKATINGRVLVGSVTADSTTAGTQG